MGSVSNAVRRVFNPWRIPEKQEEAESPGRADCDMIAGTVIGRAGSS